jgi:hypothetical protein
MSIHENTARYSMVDQWAPAAVRSEGSPIPRPQSRSFSSPESRRSSQSGLSQPPINAPPTRAQAPRPMSASAAVPSPQRVSAPSNHNRDYSAPSSPPPVPQIPQQWLPPSGNALTGIAEDTRRGRPRASSSATTLGLVPPPLPADRPPPPDSQRRLQKRSRSTGR